MIPSFPKTATELAASGFPLPPRDAGIAAREVGLGCSAGGYLNQREATTPSGKTSGAWQGGSNLLLPDRVSCVFSVSCNPPLPSMPPAPTHTAFSRAAIRNASQPNIQATCTQDPVSSTLPSNQTGPGLPIPAGDQTCPFFPTGTLLLSTAQPQLGASDL